MADVKVGDTIKAGTLLLLTSGAYSDYGVNGIYRAKADFVVPGVKSSWQREPEADIHAISANPAWVEELTYIEIWRDN